MLSSLGGMLGRRSRHVDVSPQLLYSSQNLLKNNAEVVVEAFLPRDIWLSKRLMLGPSVSRNSRVS